jgi:predicted RNase H-like nuclease
MSKGPEFVGVDGCPGGWFAVFDQGDALRSERYSSFAELWIQHRNARRILVDVPIGLPKDGTQYPRECDRLAQRKLGRRACTIFRVPVSSVLREADHARASSLHRTSTEPPKGISRQIHALRDKLLEMDDFFAQTPAARSVVAESHPELCFRALLGTPLPAGKTSREGRRERLRIMEARDPRVRGAYDWAKANFPRGKVSLDDIVDALVLGMRPAKWTWNPSRPSRCPSAPTPCRCASSSRACSRSPKRRS